MVSNEYRESMRAWQELTELNFGYRSDRKVMSAYGQERICGVLTKKGKHGVATGLPFSCFQRERDARKTHHA